MISFRSFLSFTSTFLGTVASCRQGGGKSLNLGNDQKVEGFRPEYPSLVPLLWNNNDVNETSCITAFSCMIFKSAGKACFYHFQFVWQRWIELISRSPWNSFSFWGDDDDDVGRPLGATPPAPYEPAPGSLEMPSIGSHGHSAGACKPCAFVHTKGCDNGAMCLFCHLCGRGEKKRRQKATKAFSAPEYTQIFLGKSNLAQWNIYQWYCRSRCLLV